MGVNILEDVKLLKDVGQLIKQLAITESLGQTTVRCVESLIQESICYAPLVDPVSGQNSSKVETVQTKFQLLI